MPTPKTCVHLRTLALATVLVGAAHTWGQPAAPDASAPAAAAQTAAPAAASQSAVIDGFVTMDITKRAAWLGSQVNANAFTGWSDEDVLAMAHAMKPEALMRWLKAEVARLPEYGYRMRRQERVKDQWQGQTALILIRYRNTPRQIHTHWLRDGAHVGQEVIYDETVRENEIYSHLGRLVGLMVIWSALDGSLARSQLNHTVRELGLRFIIDTVERNGRAYVAVGSSDKFNEAKMVTEDGEHVLQLTWDTPNGLPTFYVKRTHLYFDLEDPWVRIEEAWDESGSQLEKIIIESVMRRTWSDQTFNPKNPECKF